MFVYSDRWKRTSEDKRFIGVGRSEDDPEDSLEELS